MINVRLDHELATQVFPVAEVHGIVVCFAHWRGGRDDYVSVNRVYWPVWAWRDRVGAGHERPEEKQLSTSST